MSAYLSKIAGVLYVAIVALAAALTVFDFDNGVPALVVLLLAMWPPVLPAGFLAEAVQRRAFERALAGGDPRAARALLAAWRGTKKLGARERASGVWDIRELRVLTVEGRWDEIAAKLDGLGPVARSDADVQRARARLQAYRTGSSSNRDEEPTLAACDEIVRAHLINACSSAAIYFVVLLVSVRLTNPTQAISLALFALLVSWVLQVGALSARIQQAMTRAHAAHDVDGMRYALARYRATSVATPESLAMMEASLHERMGNPEQSLSRLLTIDRAKLNPAVRPLYDNNVAWAHLQAGRAGRAMQLALAAMEGMPVGHRSEEALLDTLASAQRAEGLVTEAKGTYARLLARHPRNERARNALAELESPAD